MSFTLLSFVVLAILATIACIEIYRGVHRGFLLSLVALGNIVVSLLLSFVLTPLVSGLIADEVIDILTDLSVYQNFAKSLPSLNSVASAIVEMLISSFLFIFVFFALRIVLSWPINLVCRWCAVQLKDDPGYGREDNSCASRSDKMKGAVCGGISAILITMIITCPIMGSLDIANHALSIVGNASNKAISAIGRNNVRMVEHFSNDITGNIFYRCGGRWIYSSAASTTMFGKRVYLLSEVETVERISGDMLAVYGIFQKPQDVTEEHLQALENLRMNLPDLKVCERLIGDVIRQCSTAWKDGKTFFTVKRPAMNPMVEPAFIAILEECSNTTSYTARQNADTLLEIYGIILDSGVFGLSSDQYPQILTVLAEHRTIEKVELALSKNPNMENISAASIMMGAFASYIDSRNLNDTQTNLFMKSIATALNKVNAASVLSNERKAKELATYAQQYFADMGMDIPLSVIEMLSLELITELPGTNISDKDVKFIFEKYKNG